MQKISPLKAGFNAFNKLKPQKLKDSGKNFTPPFNTTFMGTVIQMDVFDSSMSKTPPKNIFSGFFKKLLNTELSFDFLDTPVSKLQKCPSKELEEMFKIELVNLKDKI